MSDVHTFSNTRAHSSRGEAGFTIIEILISTAIIGIIGLGMTSMIVQQQKSLQAIAQKQEIVDLKNMMQQHLLRSNVCTLHLLNHIVDLSRTSPTVASPTAVNLFRNTLYTGTLGASQVIAQAGQPLSVGGSGVKVAAISFKNVLQVQAGNLTDYTGEFEVSFDPTSLVIPRKPESVQVTFKVDTTTPLNARRIASCLSSQSAGMHGMRVFTANGIFTVPAGVTSVKATVIGGGGSGWCIGNSGGLNSWNSEPPSSGSSAISIINNLNEGQTIPVTVGAGAVSAPFSCNASCYRGAQGGTSSFGSFVIASGGRAASATATYLPVSPYVENIVGDVESLGIREYSAPSALTYGVYGRSAPMISGTHVCEGGKAGAVVVEY